MQPLFTIYLPTRNVENGSYLQKKNSIEMNMRNMTVKIGCCCVIPKLQFLNLRNSGPQEKNK